MADNHLGDNDNSFYLRESLAALQCYLSSGEPRMRSRILPSIPTPPIISECLSSKSGGACVAGRMIGRSIRTLITAKKLAGGSRGRIITPACLAPISRKGTVRKMNRASSLTVISRACSTRLVTGLCRAKIGLSASDMVANFADSHDISPAKSSPPVSPSGSLCSSAPSIDSMVASLRSMQLGQLKSLPPSPGFGSPGRAATRPGLCSLPSTPTRNVSRPGIGYFDFWDEEEPAMEQVEWGRHFRSKMFEKLSKENSLETVNSGQCYENPVLDWVSDLVN
ncbi:putative myoinositol oxygenase [Hibiscus syriacus]|uniref:Myoinositol oxygenase n=1 Tax=Hibiscus syriacus TaxID=106335 RepID=A0A6A2YHN3_HIBSY|nr:putative myoinositol oxygenase [Hibiscus syriacus]